MTTQKITRSICLLIYFVIAMAFMCSAQETLIQLQQQLKSTNSDTVRANTYLAIAKYYAKVQFDSSARYAILASSHSERIGFSKGILRAFLYQGPFFKNSGNYREAVNAYRKALPLAEQMNFVAAIPPIYNNLGNLYTNLRQLDSALFYLYKSLELKEKKNDIEGIIASYINIGNLHASRWEYRKAGDYYTKGLRLEESKNNPVQRCKLVINLGNTFYELQMYDSAVYFYNKALQIKTESKVVEDWNTLYHNLGNIHLNYRHDEKTALKLYTTSLEISEKTGDTFRIINALNNIGNVYSVKEDYSKALKYYETALRRAEQMGFKDQVKSILENIATCNEKQNNFSLAIKNLKRQKELSDSLYNRQKAALLAEMEIKFKTSQKEKLLVKERAENEKKVYERNAFILASIFLFVLLSIIVAVYIKTKSINRTLASQKKIIEKREHEKELLLRELHHRAKNNLQLVSSLLNLQANKLKDTEAADAVKEGQTRVEAMALIHRDLYRRENVTRVNLKTYLGNMVSNLMNTYNFSKSDFSLTMDIKEIELEADLAIPLGLIANELISNSFKHAFTHQQHPELVIVAGEMSENELHLLIRDNGRGMDSSSSKEESFGVTMIHSLVKQLQGSITFENDNGCVVTLIVPIKKEEFVES